MDGGWEWFPLPSLSANRGPERLLPAFTRLAEHLEAFRLAVDAATLQRARDLAQNIVEHILACLRARSADFPMEALCDGLTVEEEEAAHAAIHDLAAEVVGYFALAPVDEGADGKGEEDPGAAPTTSANEASDGSSAATAR